MDFEPYQRILSGENRLFLIVSWFLYFLNDDFLKKHFKFSNKILDSFQLFDYFEKLK